MPSPQEGLVAVAKTLDFESMYRQTFNSDNCVYTLTVTATVRNYSFSIYLDSNPAHNPIVFVDITAAYSSVNHMNPTL